MVFKDPLTAQTRGIHTISNYEQMDLGRAGELRVNEYNQELLLTREELSLAGDNLPVRLQRIYHSYPTGQNSVGAYGVQWSINYSVRLRYDTAGGFFVYDRDDGSRTVFQKTKWVSGDWVCWRETSEIGLLYQLWLPKGSTDVSQAKMKTIHGTYQSFDSMGRMVQITDIDRPENGIRIAYQDGDRIQSITDSIGRVYCFGYNPKGQLISIACQEQDGRQIQFSTENGAKVPFVLEYSYDNSGNLIQASYPDGECVRYDYTRTGRLSQIHTVDEKQFAISYDGKRVKQIEQIADVGTQAHRKTLIEMNQDLKERIRSILISGPTNESLNTQITYQSDENALVTQYISAYIADENSVSSDWEYTYDANGRIRTIVKNGGLAASFRYDEAGQLNRVNDVATQTTTIYSYDVGGNLTQKREYPYTISENPENVRNTVTYGYEDAEWKNKLTSYGGKQIVYDEIGNPVQYEGKQYQWTAGRMLEGYTDESYKIAYTYDQSGLRQRKTIMDQDASAPVMEYHYYWNGDLPAGFEVTEYTQSGPVTDTVCYCFGDDGTIYGFLVNGTDAYLYERNAQGDVVGIYHGGERVASYTYDAYGRMLSADEMEVELSKLNLLYYRGYCMDRETELYYLQSRYYVPEWGRFLNADVYVDTGTGLNGTNLFAYCDNDPVNRIDPNGYWGLDVHKTITQELHKGGNNPAAIERVVDGNLSLDNIYPAWVAIYRNQKFHFDRRNDLTYQSNKDTRFEQAENNIVTAVTTFIADSYDMDGYYYLGRAEHSAQDYAAHGDIGLDNRILASDATNRDVDDYKYDWSDSSRGRYNVKGCVKPTVNEQYSRLREAWDKSVAYFITFSYLLTEYL